MAKYVEENVYAREWKPGAMTSGPPPACPKCGSDQTCRYIAHPGKHGCYSCGHGWHDESLTKRRWKRA